MNHVYIGTSIVLECVRTCYYWNGQTYARSVPRYVAHCSGVVDDPTEGTSVPLMMNVGVDHTPCKMPWRCDSFTLSITSSDEMSSAKRARSAPNDSAIEQNTSFSAPCDSASPAAALNSDWRSNT